MLNKSKLGYGIGFIAVLGLGFAMGATMPQSFAQKKDADPYKRLDVFAQVLSVVERNYVEPTDRTAMIDGAIHGMIRALDPH